MNTIKEKSSEFISCTNKSKRPITRAEDAGYFEATRTKLQMIFCLRPPSWMSTISYMRLCIRLPFCQTRTPRHSTRRKSSSLSGNTIVWCLLFAMLNATPLLIPSFFCQAQEICFLSFLMSRGLHLIIKMILLRTKFKFSAFLTLTFNTFMNKNESRTSCLLHVMLGHRLEINLKKAWVNVRRIIFFFRLPPK